MLQYHEGGGCIEMDLIIWIVISEIERNVVRFCEAEIWQFGSGS